MEGLVELKLATTGIVWMAHVEAQGTDHLRVKLKGDDLGVLPVLTTGTSLECTMRAADGRYYVIGSVLKQESAIVWLSLPPIWRMEERRDTTRNTGGFGVKYVNSEASGLASCIDISAGGIRVRTRTELTSRTHVELLFTLPGEALPVRVEGIILYSRPAEKIEHGFETGVKFIDLAIGDSMRISRYCRG
jgi:hypothetical protein